MATPSFVPPPPAPMPGTPSAQNILKLKIHDDAFHKSFTVLAPADRLEFLAYLREQGVETWAQLRASKRDFVERVPSVAWRLALKQWIKVDRTWRKRKRLTGRTLRVRRDSRE